MSALFTQSSVLLGNNLIQKDPGVIVGPIAAFLGIIMDFFFNMAYFFTESHSLGISIVLLTLTTRFIMLPLAIKSQKSMMAMQKLQPEMDKIKAKYGNSKDPEIQQKMNAEIQAMYSKNKVNPFSGCLPMVIQMPIFFALSALMQQSFKYIGILGGIYKNLSDLVLSIPDDIYDGYLTKLLVSKIPNNMTIDVGIPENMSKVLNKFTEFDWADFMGQLSPEFVAQFTPLIGQKQNIEHFLGINLLNNSGWGFPGIIIPILAVATSFLSSWLMMRNQKTSDSNAKMQQQMMLYFTPLLMGFMTVSMPAGVGVYWITSSVFQCAQQAILNRFYARK